MAIRIEWRSKAEGFDSLLAVDDSNNAVVETWDVDPDILTDFLNDMTRMGKGHDKRYVDQPPPEDWGELVIARTDTGDVSYVDPELYWGGVAYWFAAGRRAGGRRGDERLARRRRLAPNPTGEDETVVTQS